MVHKPISAQTYRRMPGYYNLILDLKKQGEKRVSAPVIARELGYHEVQVRKDLAAVSDMPGKPRMGFEIEELLRCIGEVLGFHNQTDAVLVGVGRLGRALLGYPGFEACGVQIIAAFDENPAFHGSHFDGRQVFSLDKLYNLCVRLQIKLGVIAVPADDAQEVCDLLLAAGIKGIWNFAPVHLRVPEDIVVQNENLAAHLAMLSQRLTQREEEAK